MKFWNDVGDPRRLYRRFAIVSIKFYAGDIRTQICDWVVTSLKIGPQFFWTQKFATAFCCRGLSLPCGKVWLSSVGWTACAKPGNKEIAEISEGG